MFNVVFVIKNENNPLYLYHGNYHTNVQIYPLNGKDVYITSKNQKFSKQII